MTSQTEDAVAVLGRLNRQFIANHVANDAVAHARLLHPQFTYLGSTGQWLDRQDYLRGWAHWFDAGRMVYWDMRDERIDVFGAVALVSACNKSIELVGGEEHVSFAAYTDTYLLEDGRWRCIRAQIGPVAEDNWPLDSTIVCAYHHGIRAVA
jgi:ketosteroid isomerase-like protein